MQSVEPIVEITPPKRVVRETSGLNFAAFETANLPLKYTDDTSLMAESEEELKSLLMKEKEEREKAGLKLNIQKTKTMASRPITSQQLMGKQWKQ